jgi:hypothetical protein
MISSSRFHGIAFGGAPAEATPEHGADGPGSAFSSQDG